MSPICQVLGIGRATVYRASAPRPRHYAMPADRPVAAQIHEIIRERASYGYRRVTAVVNRTFGVRYNRKRIRRVMALEGWTLARPAQRRSGRAHTGQVRRPYADERWCSDTLEIACWNGEVVELGFALDCADRECLAWVAAPRALTGADIRHLMQQAIAARFGATGWPQRRLEWLSDNGSIYTALETVIAAERLGLTPITTPAYSPQSNGLAERFVRTLRRDYLDGADRSTAAVVLDQLPRWLEDYNTQAPHAALGYRAPREYRALQAAVQGHRLGQAVSR